MNAMERVLSDDLARAIAEKPLEATSRLAA
jgi:hypothetical protein